MVNSTTADSAASRVGSDCEDVSVTAPDMSLSASGTLRSGASGAFDVSLVADDVGNEASSGCTGSSNDGGAPGG